jgi:hypothetical protein
MWTAEKMSKRERGREGRVGPDVDDEDEEGREKRVEDDASSLCSLYASWLSFGHTDRQTLATHTRASRMSSPPHHAPSSRQP